ncbi:MAG: hypothetical protein SPK49_02705 [Erysipelotrichaceae bacterium]|nr:hypothetical protein [Erysipelotrichaceae bacterium]
MKNFNCYSMRLARALIDAGFKPISLNSNPRTKQMYYIFEATEQLMHFKNNIYQTVRDKY